MPLLQRQLPGAILIVEDHELTISLLTQLLTMAFPSRCIHVARGVMEALRKAAEVSPAVIVIDIGLPDGSGLELTRHIAARTPEVHIVVHSTHDGKAFHDESLKAGARAFVSKNRIGELVPVLERLIPCST